MTIYVICALHLRIGPHVLCSGLRQHVCMDSCGLFLGLYALDTADSNRHQPKVLQLSFGTNLTLTVFHMAFSQKDAPYAAATKEIISRKNMAA